jgi:xylulokinase
VWEPYVRGERTPLHDPYRRAALHQLDLTTEPGGIRRAAFEASGFVVRHHLDLAASAPNAEIVPRRVVATGGGTRVPEWLQALADCTGLPVDVVAIPEGGALGAAFVARMAAGLESSMADAARWARHSRRIEPDSAWVPAVEERYKCFRALAGG